MILESFFKPPMLTGIKTSKGYIFPTLEVIGAIMILGE